MAIHYNLNVLSKRKNFSVYDLAASGIIGASTCNALYRQKPVMTETLLRLLDFCDCSLDDFLDYQPEERPSENVRSLDLGSMVERGIISRTAKRAFQNGRPMYLSTLLLIAEDQKADLLDFFRIKTEVTADSTGNLKKKHKVLYLSEW